MSKRLLVNCVYAEKRLDSIWNGAVFQAIVVVVNKSNTVDASHYCQTSKHGNQPDSLEILPINVIGKTMTNLWCLSWGSTESHLTSSWIKTRLFSMVLQRSQSKAEHYKMRIMAGQRKLNYAIRFDRCWLANFSHMSLSSISIVSNSINGLQHENHPLINRTMEFKIV